MASIRKVKVKDIGKHILVKDNSFFNFYVFQKVDDWILRPKKIRGDYDIPMEVYQTLWVQGYRVM